MDNPASEPTTPKSEAPQAPSDAPLTIDDAAALMAALPEEAAPADPPAEATPETPAEEPTVTVKIDGKDVEVPLSELKNGYQRQADYTRKTMAVAEASKAAEAEASKAKAERAAYAQNLQKMQAMLEGSIEAQQNWTEERIAADPVGYLQQQRIANERQAKLQQVYAEQQRVASLTQAENQQALARHLEAQQQELLAKLPEWKDNAKATAEKNAIRDYLLDAGYQESDVSSITDARAVVMARKAMLFDQMVSKAQVAAKKVSTLPTKVERPGAGDAPTVDRRSAAFQKLAKSGRVEDAAAVFATLL